MIVKNLNGTASKKCNCASWLEHWYNFGGHGNQRNCANTTCSNLATLGGHVKLHETNDHSHYIVPLCNSCNKLSNPFRIKSTLVSANKQVTCK